MARSKDKVVVGIVHPVEVGAGFMQTIWMLSLRDQATSGRIADVIMENASANICNARNAIVRQFLDKGVGDWLWLVDADMVLEPDTLDRLLDSAHHLTHPIVGALCFGVHQHRLFPTLYAMQNDESGRPYTVRFGTFPATGKMQVHATGAACLLVHRRVLQAIRDHRDPETGRPFNPAYPWFQETAQETSSGWHPVGEDVTFCLRAGALGFPVYVDCGIEVGHQKAMILSSEMYHDQRLLDAIKSRPDVLGLLAKEPTG